ncbi:tyrosine-type recombinase/integrase [Agrobacterium rhizogenes]|nr:tyrosine-type recombinase/integrase [Rhizobium rhizogenes]NTF75134.1 tyrosine-type recombinase/integrase [Rhizobium rhizogenes]NTH51528.1 tyrosine-type recombinase/integrase [Rhizobium rhizogenes]NTH71112.1 tyrosine-type recombinase/integrase [Rhizobium rhizogenes]
MAKHKLTLAGIKKLKVGIHSDGDGLYLRIRKGGSASWVFIYKRGDLRKEYGLGGFGQGTAPVSLELARKKAHQLRERLAEGEDLAEAETKVIRRRPADTFMSLIDVVIERETKNTRNERHREQWRSTLREYARHLHNMPIAKIRRSDVADAIRDRWESTPETARRTLTRIAAVFDYAKAHDMYFDENPAVLKNGLGKLLPEHVKKEQDHHEAVPYADMPAVMAALRSDSGVAARAVEFIALTAVRAGEARGAVFDEFDLGAKTWTIPAERTKSNREHRVPLSDRAVTIITAREQEATGSLVFEGRTEGKGVSEQSLLRALRAAVGGETMVTTHGLRSTFRDWGGNSGYAQEALEKALAHGERNKTISAYRRDDMLEQRRPIMAEWATYCGSHK